MADSQIVYPVLDFSIDVEVSLEGLCEYGLSIYPNSNTLFPAKQWRGMVIGEQARQSGVYKFKCNKYFYFVALPLMNMIGQKVRFI